MSRKWFRSLIFGSLFAAVPGMAALIVVPGSNATVEAGGDLAYPFVTPGTVRVQQLIRASQFTLFPTGTTYRITGMAVRADSGGLGGAFQVSDQMTITAGATSLTGNTFGANMDSNASSLLGAVQVFSGTANMTFSTKLTAPYDFGTFITFQNPIDYNPASGNFFLDMVTTGSSSVTPLEGQVNCLKNPSPTGCNLDAIMWNHADRINAPAVRVRSAPGASLSTATVGLGENGLEDRAYVIQFNAIPVSGSATPEPGTWIMMGAGLTGILAAKRQSRVRE